MEGQDQGAGQGQTPRQFQHRRRSRHSVQARVPSIDTGCLALNYNGNPGVNGVSYRGVYREAAAAIAQDRRQDGRTRRPGSVADQEEAAAASRGVATISQISTISQGGGSLSTAPARVELSSRHRWEAGTHGRFDAAPRTIRTGNHSGSSPRDAQGASSVHRGVSWDRRAGKWRAQIKVHGCKRRHLGVFADEEEAAAAYKGAAAAHTVAVEEDAAAADVPYRGYGRRRRRPALALWRCLVAQAHQEARVRGGGGAVPWQPTARVALQRWMGVYVSAAQKEEAEEEHEEHGLQEDEGAVASLPAAVSSSAVRADTPLSRRPPPSTQRTELMLQLPMPSSWEDLRDILLGTAKRCVSR